MRVSAPCSLVLAVLLVLAFALSTPTQALADRGGTHDGFFLRLSTGLGYASVSGDNDNSATFKGATSQSSIAIGGIVTENLALHADIFAVTLVSPDVTIGGITYSDLDITMRAGALGIGLTYYFMPLNLYLSGSIGAAVASTKVVFTDSTSRTYESGTGFGLNLMVGKEWWVSENWGIGVAGQLIYVDISTEYEAVVSSRTIPGALTLAVVEDSATGTAGGVLFTATFN